MMIKVVIDTNIFISGIFWYKNYCSEIIDLWGANKFSLVSSLEIVEELVRTLNAFKIQMGEEMVNEWCDMIIENATIVEPVEQVKVITSDPDDNKFLEAARAGDVQYIVSQDKHLLNIGEYQGIKIVTPEEFLRLF